MNNNNDHLNEALALQLTTRGVPVIYYGDEQYLHNDTGGGGDPYNRPQMTTFSTSSTAYKVIKALSGLRQANDAIAYGTSAQRWMNNDVYIYERQFFNDVGDSLLLRLNNASVYGLTMTSPDFMPVMLERVGKLRGDVKAQGRARMA